MFAACLKHLLPIRLFYIASKDFGFYTKAACLGGTGSKSSHHQSAQHNAFLSDSSRQVQSKQHHGYKPFLWRASRRRPRTGPERKCSTLKKHDKALFLCTCPIILNVHNTPSLFFLYWIFYFFLFVVQCCKLSMRHQNVGKLAIKWESTPGGFLPMSKVQCPPLSCEGRCTWDPVRRE